MPACAHSHCAARVERGARVIRQEPGTAHAGWGVAAAAQTSSVYISPREITPIILAPEAALALPGREGFDAVVTLGEWWGWLFREFPSMLRWFCNGSSVKSGCIVDDSDRG